MGEHRHNPMAMAMANGGPVRPEFAASLSWGHVPKRHIVEFPEHKVRILPSGEMEVLARAVREADGKAEVAAEETWQAPPEGVVIHVTGVPWTLEEMDFAIHVAGVMLNGQLTDANGSALAKALPLVELYRQDARTHAAMFEPGRKPPPATFIAKG